MADRVAVTRDVGNVVMDLDAVEAIRLLDLLGNEHVTIGDVTGTERHERQRRPRRGPRGTTI